MGVKSRYSHSQGLGFEGRLKAFNRLGVMGDWFEIQTIIGAGICPVKFFLLRFVPHSNAGFKRIAPEKA
jgi:hypothetical protein